MAGKGEDCQINCGIMTIENYKFSNSLIMAKTNEGKKKVYVHEHTKTASDGKKVKVPAHYRSTPN